MKRSTTVNRTNLTQKQMQELWGEDGPYSQAHLIVEERILDDSVSRTFLYVQTFINPFTFRFIKKHKKKFANDPMVNHILNMAEYKGLKDGFVSTVHGDQFVDGKDRDNAEKILVEARKAVIRMHQFVLETIQGKRVVEPVLLNAGRGRGLH